MGALMGWYQPYLSVEALNLQGNLVEEWTNYTQLLNQSVVFLQDLEDELQWSWNKFRGALLTKLGYEYLIVQDLTCDRI
jgi:hypothetical protein